MSVSQVPDSQVPSGGEHLALLVSDTARNQWPADDTKHEAKNPDITILDREQVFRAINSDDTSPDDVHAAARYVHLKARIINSTRRAHEMR